MIVKTESGFEVNVREEIVTDFRFLKAVRDMAGNDDVKQVAAVIDMTEMLMSPEDVDRLSEHVVNADGIVPAEAVVRELDEILRKISGQDNRVKNS